MVSEYVTIVTFILAILDAGNYSYLLWVAAVCCGLLFSNEVKTVQNVTNSDDNKSAMILAFGLCTVSGFIIGIITGWVIWG